MELSGWWGELGPRSTAQSPVLVLLGASGAQPCFCPRRTAREADRSLRAPKSSLAALSPRIGRTARIASPYGCKRGCEQTLGDPGASPDLPLASTAPHERFTGTFPLLNGPERTGNLQSCRAQGSGPSSSPQIGSAPSPVGPRRSQRGKYLIVLCLF